MVKRSIRIIIYYKFYIYIILTFPFLLYGEINYAHKGYFDIGTIHRLSDGSIIKVPYRMLTYEPFIVYNNLTLNASSAIEFRLKDKI